MAYAALWCVLMHAVSRIIESYQIGRDPLLDALAGSD